MLTAKESPFFLNKTADFLDADTRQAFINWIAMNPLAGDVIKGTGGLGNQRAARCRKYSRVKAASAAIMALMSAQRAAVRPRMMRFGSYLV